MCVAFHATFCVGELHFHVLAKLVARHVAALSRRSEVDGWGATGDKSDDRPVVEFSSTTLKFSLLF